MLPLLHRKASVEEKKIGLFSCAGTSFHFLTLLACRKGEPVWENLTTKSHISICWKYQPSGRITLFIWNFQLFLAISVIVRYCSAFKPIYSVEIISPTNQLTLLFKYLFLESSLILIMEKLMKYSSHIDKKYNWVELLLDRVHKAKRNIHWI